ncbi:GNAT family N-acetyltransferase [Clostridium oceanicum]|uniref:GNAT family N-acetyltransferase n=1 Tax=Clostridium oceanicum TaxID=1543 RepID=A0ABP3UP13_9CLOT
MVIEEFKEVYLIEILDLFYKTVHTINSKDYNKNQLDAWAIENPDKKIWLNSLEKNVSYVARENNKIVGFGDLNNEKYIDRLYVHEKYQRKRVASKILSVLEKEAKNLGYKEVYTEASITAKPFFLAKKYYVLKKQHKHHNGQVFINYIMKKDINNM